MNSKKPLKGLLVASDVDGTITSNDTLFDFFKEFDLKEEAEKLNLTSPSSDVSIILEKITSKEPVKQDVFVKVANQALLFPGARQFYSKLERLGATVCLLTTTYAPIAFEISKRLKLERPVICATNVWKRNGRVTGFKGPVMEGLEKEKAFSSLMRKNKPRKLVGLADSKGDLFFMNRIELSGGRCFWVKKPNFYEIEKKVLAYVEGELK